MNLIKDNHKYMKREYYDLEDIPSRKRKLQGLIKECFFKFYVTESKWTNKGMKDSQRFILILSIQRRIKGTLLLIDC